MGAIFPMNFDVEIFALFRVTLKPSHQTFYPIARMPKREEI